MVLMKKCSFCGYDIEPGTGTNYIRADGKVIYFCSKKCRIHMLKLGHRPTKIRWTKAYRDVKRK